jgi:hypothetical protein
LPIKKESSFAGRFFSGGSAWGGPACLSARRFNREVCFMVAPRLRVFPRSPGSSYQDCQKPDVRVSLRDLLPLISLAKRQKFLWLDDFLDDEVRITSDLYDVLRAFSSVRKPSA